MGDEGYVWVLVVFRDTSSSESSKCGSVFEVDYTVLFYEETDSSDNFNILLNTFF